MSDVFLLQSQGITVFQPNSVYTDLNECFEAAMAYVILSRVTSIKQLFLKKFDEKKIYCSKVAKAEAGRLRARAINLQETEWDQPREGRVRISTINARSLKQHYQDLTRDQFILKSDIISVQETWLEESLQDPISHYHHFYVHGRSKGIALLTRAEPIHIESFQSDHCSIIKATYPTFDLINFYRFSCSTDIKQFTTEVLPLLNASRTQVLLGDTNVDYQKSPQNHFSHSLDQRGYQQKVTSPTHLLGALLDHVYFCSPHKEASCELYKSHSVFWSDHSCQSIILYAPPLSS